MSEGAKPVMSFGAVKTCRTCLYYFQDTASQSDKCMRFARFVDHVITDVTKDCSYWDRPE